MNTLQEYEDEKSLEEIINKIIELKYDKTKDNKLEIQKLQQELIAVENRLKKK